jgi:predicted Na+-dependent transporter
MLCIHTLLPDAVHDPSPDVQTRWAVCRSRSNGTVRVHISGAANFGFCLVLRLFFLFFLEPWLMLTYLLQVVLAPVLLGALLNQYCNGLVQLVSPLMPFIAVAAVAVLCGNAIAQNASAVLASGSQVVLSVGCLHASGFFFGYVLSRVLGIDISSARTISIEVGMQVTGVEISYHYPISFYLSSS